MGEEERSYIENLEMFARSRDQAHRGECTGQETMERDC